MASPPRGDRRGWRQVFRETFATNCAEGDFLKKYGDRWAAYPWPWADTKGQVDGQSRYDPALLSVRRGVLTMRLHVGTDGTARCAAPVPMPPGGRDRLYGRYSVRFRADPAPGWKTAWLLWPQSGVWPRDGEIDFPEGPLTGTISGFMHRQDGATPGDQDAYRTAATYRDWHTATTEWTPDRVVFALDGHEVGRSTKRIPSTPMHWVLQTETTRPLPTQPAKVYVDWVTMHAYDP
jgi:hypothetical protein